MIIVLVGSIAALCTTIAFLPQVIKVYKTKHTKDLSMMMYVIFTIGVIFWMYFGILTEAWPIIIANALILILCVYILIMKKIYG